MKIGAPGAGMIGCVLAVSSALVAPLAEAQDHDHSSGNSPPQATPTPPGDAVVIESPPCGPTAMAVALRLLDRRSSNAELSALADANGEASFAELRDFALAKGLYAEAVTGSLHDLLALDAPAILHLFLPSDDRSNSVEEGHFVVLAGRHAIDSVVVLDPTAVTPFNGVTPIEPLLERWSGAALVISDQPIEGLPPPLLIRGATVAVTWMLPVAAALLLPYAILSHVARRR